MPVWEPWVNRKMPAEFGEETIKELKYLAEMELAGDHEYKGKDNKYRVVGWLSIPKKLFLDKNYGSLASEREGSEFITKTGTKTDTRRFHTPYANNTRNECVVSFYVIDKDGKKKWMSKTPVEFAKYFNWKPGHGKLIGATIPDTTPDKIRPEDQAVIARLKKEGDPNAAQNEPTRMSVENLDNPEPEIETIKDLEKGE